MKKYKTIIIDGKKLLRQMFCFFCCCGFLIFFLIGMQKNKFVPEEILKKTLPILEVSEAKNQDKKDWGDLWERLLLFHPGKMETVIAREIPMAETVWQTGVAKLVLEKNLQDAPMVLPKETLPEQVIEEIPIERQAPIKVVDAGVLQKSSTGLAIANETSYEVDAKALLNESPSIDMSGDGPKVLVVHTHATEAYAPEGSTVYDTEGSGRSENLQENVVKVGEVFCEILREKGIETLHDKVLHDIPSFNGSYAHSLASMEDYLKKYPGIQVIFDIHRDSIIYQDKTKAKLVTEIDGQSAAQLMFVVGSDQKGLEHPHWRENIKNAVHLQNAIYQRYPTLMRHINLRRERFNGHTTKATMIIETGSCGNSLSEALYGITLAANCIGDYLNQL